MNPAPNLVLVGPMGAGKTSIGRRLAERFGLDFVDADHFVEQRTGATIAAIFEHVGESGFRERESGALAELLAGEGRLVATGGGAVLDAGNRRLMRARSFVAYLSADLDSQLRRLGRDRTRPLLQRGDREQVLRDLAEFREPLYREVADLVMETDHLTASEAAVRLGMLLAERWSMSGAAA
ncbi:shikimate kinase [Pseudoxanthomonas broegbernensis]|uniref:Shikimate kinase n=1 Tax=Pseudoxanthomonas broegbernensis TaxID=83619 RepID=A0A7V8GK04_9GAMM|nr:shikimate kinase [Pseudoxanthomonas broegbernensis]KAF1684758.1 shikimate kinase [Pseudoxanthomonas broegbernensis]MBB6064178.1 shikimate kinase [Pseudoxanthomonas broegbernensis]